MTRHLLAVAVAAVLGTLAAAADDKKGTTVEVGGMKGTAPADWTSEKPANEMRKAQFKLAKEKDDAEDGLVTVFSLSGGGGVTANLDRQPPKFKFPDGVKKEDAVKVEDVTVGEFKGKYQDIKGTFKGASFDTNAKEKEKYRQLYVVFEDGDKNTIALVLVGPEKTVEKHKKAFDEFVKSFKK
jgi:opacity protein-like surface antigen